MTTYRSLLLLLYGSALTVCCQSCGPKKSEKVNYISGAWYKLWLKKDQPEQLRGTSTYFYFDNKGGFEVYKKYKNSNKLSKYDGGDVVLIKKWFAKSDKSINIAGETYKIALLNDSCFKFTDASNKTITLVYTKDRLN